MSIRQKSFTILVTFATFVLPFALTGTTDKGIDKTMAEWFQAVKRGDSAVLASLVTEDAEFWTHGAPPLKGRTELKNAFDAFFTQYKTEQRFVELERHVFGKWAFIRGEEINILTPKAGEEPVEYRQRAFSVLHKDSDGRWRFARGMTNKGPITKK